ncbi:MAG: ABC transporter permease [Anaerolineae bacterium]|jgi:ABC-type dipeptide/oligopeptide/nickel transport system permease subunit|nr:ABC transporter permease [Anaerolineae bacterium]MDX9830752.1 ABC transporter permease [Anaerolineae bacterium]
MTPTTFERVPAIRHKLARSESEIDLARESRGYWDSALLALRRDRLTLAAFAMLLVTALFCFVLARPVTEALGIDPNDTDPLIAFEGPSVAHPMGVDQVGRDQLARLLYGGRVSIGIGFFAAVIIMTIGLALGSIAGFYGKIVDDVVMWFINTLNSIPFILLLLIISLLFKPTALTLTIFIGLVSWTEISRIVRGQVLQVKEMEYVTAARALGTPTSWLIVRHILPNVVPVAIIFSAQVIGGVILIESALSFLGLGVQPPTATWGNMLNKAQSYFTLAPHLVVWPGLLISLTVLCLYVIGDGLRDALDPTMRGKR